MTEPTTPTELDPPSGETPSSERVLSFTPSPTAKVLLVFLVGGVFGMVISWGVLSALSKSPKLREVTEDDLLEVSPDELAHLDAEDQVREADSPPVRTEPEE